MEKLMYWLAGGLGVPLINWLKTNWGLSGKAAMWLTVAVAGLLAVLALLLTQQLGADNLNPEQLLSTFGQVLAAATLAYNLLTKVG